MKEQAKKAPTQIEVTCDVEQKVVGHLRLVAGDRPKVVHPEILSGAYTPTEERYRMHQTGKRGDYWHCPHCGGRLCIRGTKRTGEVYPHGHPKAGQQAPPVQGVLSPVILGRTQVQVG